MTTHLTGCLVPEYPCIPVTPWKWIRCCTGSANSNLYPHLCIPVVTLSRVYPYPCHALISRQIEQPAKRAHPAAMVPAMTRGNKMALPPTQKKQRGQAVKEAFSVYQ